MSVYSPTVEELKKLIWEKQGLNTYEILEILIQRGYTYKRQSHIGDVIAFESLISRLKSDKDIIYDADKDEYYLRKWVTIQLPIVGSGKRGNCYDCLYCRELTAGVHSKYKGEPDRYDRYYACALDPVKSIRLQIEFPYGWVCPLNEAIDRLLKEDESKDENKTEK